MQRAQHQVARNGSLKSDFRRFRVANFAHQNHVGILTQNGSQAARKGQARFDIHLDLVDSGQLVFDRIFDGHNIHFRRASFAIIE